MKRFIFPLLTAIGLLSCVTPPPEPAPTPSSPPPEPAQVAPEPQPPVEATTPEPNSSTEAIACGAQGKECSAGSYCRLEKAARCGEATSVGVCAPVPQICNRMFAPVCGCDGKTHSNACTAAAQGVNVRSEGACESKETQAKPAKCQPVRCRMFCKRGWQRGPDGCEICACAK